MVFTDIDEQGLDQGDSQYDADRVAWAKVDVTDEAAVAAGFDVALQRFGKLDLMAACAGVAPPYQLVDFPVDKFRLANEINLTGYFLFGREPPES